MAEKDIAQTKSESNADEERWEKLASKVGDQHDADVILFSGEIEHDGADDLIRIAKRSDRRTNVVLLLTTRGGSADAAFRIARCLQTHYTKLVLYIHGMCKSAGTLVAIGVDEIILSDFGEFGPLDVQLGKKDELFESTSGLDITQALTSLNYRTYDYFRTVLVGIRKGTRGQVSTRLAADIASDLAVGVYGHIYSQIDPVQLGAIERALQIAVEYGNKLARRNLQKAAIERLATGYPSHSFVIDLQEAQTLFKKVRAPNVDEEQLGACIEFVTRDETETSVVDLLNKPSSKTTVATPTQEPSDEPVQDSGPGSEGERTKGGEDHGTTRQISAPPTTRSAPAAARREIATTSST